MSAELFADAQGLLFFYTCMQAPDQGDNYCHDREIQLKQYGELVVPCRGFLLDPGLRVSALPCCGCPFPLFSTPSAAT